MYKCVRGSHREMCVHKHESLHNAAFSMFAHFPNKMKPYGGHKTMPLNSITYGALRVSGAKEKQTSFAVNISRDLKI